VIKAQKKRRFVAHPVACSKLQKRPHTAERNAQPTDEHLQSLSTDTTAATAAADDDDDAL